MQFVLLLIIAVICSCSNNEPAKIDRLALVKRNNPKVSQFEALSSLSAGNGNFAVTVDATGLQTFRRYAEGCPRYSVTMGMA